MLGFGPLGLSALGQLPLSGSGVQTLAPSLFTNTNSFFTPKLTLYLKPSLFTNGQTFYSPKVSFVLHPSLFTNTQSFYNPTLIEGFLLTPDLFTNVNSFYSADVLRGPVFLLPDLFINTNVFYPEVESWNIIPLYFTGQGHIIPFHTIKQIYNEPPGDFDRWKFPYTSKDSTVNTGTFRKRNTAFGPRKTTF